MKLLINDLMQDSDAPANLISPPLTERWTGTTVTVVLNSSAEINCIGVGGTDATEITINGQAVAVAENGLYLINNINTNTLVISTNGTYIGRLAAGYAHDLPNSPMREPGFYTTTKPRRTLSGQVVPGAGGVSGREIQVEVKYKITESIYNDITAAYFTQISRGFPVFVFFDQEPGLPFARLHGTIDNKLTFQSSVRKYLYSYKFKFQEAY